MKGVEFFKWQGAGNDFVIIDNRKPQINNYSPLIIRHICDRHFGIGADGLMILETCNHADFEMKYYNSDGFEAEMCGNGGRCIAALANRLGIFEKSCKFKTIAGIHEAIIRDQGIISLKMNDVQSLHQTEDGWFLNTGVPHLVVFTDVLDELNVYELGRKLRYSKHYHPTGTNVNFVEITSSSLNIRTYERGVENETLACGTGVVASALSYAWTNSQPISTIHVHAKGGDLQVDMKRNPNGFEDIWLTGPAKEVFRGKITIDEF